MVKKLLLILIAAEILCHTITVRTITDKYVKVNESTLVAIKAVLGYSHQSVTNGMPAYSMFDNYYWQRIKVKYPISL